MEGRRTYYYAILRFYLDSKQFWGNRMAGSLELECLLCCDCIVRQINYLEFSGSKYRIGNPDPITNESIREADRPENKLSQIFFLFRGWLTSNSINSEVL